MLNGTNQAKYYSFCHTADLYIKTHNVGSAVLMHLLHFIDSNSSVLVAP